MMQLYRWKFSILLAILLVLLLVQPQVAEDIRGKIFLAVITSTLQIVLIVALAADRVERFWSMLLGLPALIAIACTLGVPVGAQATFTVAAHVLAAIFFAVTVLLILRFVLHNDVTLDHVVGALVAYLMIGVAVGQLYVVLEMERPHSFYTSEHVGSALESPHSRAACLTYFSFVTLTTSGYGDIVPATPLTRNLAWMEAVAGQFYLAVLVAGLIGIRVSRVGLVRPPGEV